MDGSHTLLTAQVHFLDTNLSLVHVPLHLYAYFLQPIIQLILPAESSTPDILDDSATGDNGTRTRRPWAFEHPFVNVSVTPVECSVVCSVALAEKYFKPARDRLQLDVREQISISDEQYVVIQVDGEGLDAGQRVLELSSPLAMNGISIFFYSTYFSDYILVPLRSRPTVISALEDRGFAFSKESEGFVNVSSPLMRPRSQHSGSASALDLSEAHDSYFQSQSTATFEAKPPSTPPPSSVSELETRTFNTLKRRHVVPTVDPSIQLIQCAGRKDTLRGGAGSHSSSTAVKHRLQLGLVKCLTTIPRARFLSLTLTDTEPASLLLEKRLLVNFEAEDSGCDDLVLLGNKNDALVPITLDLRELPMESTGIVCGIAGRLVGSTLARAESRESEEGVSSPAFDIGAGSDVLEMSYLSTAKAGTVIIPREELEMALDALKGDEERGKNGLPVEWLEMGRVG